ncbi:hypothetical protein M8120_11325 [Microcystis aeruginosa str. Chao 1910]|nr:hypothetical protein [Microcystis aeruginosa]UZO78415.1 hypothetical protein M8120_11325 [Microcystis aeruginosa str. Chao 1910]
MRTNLQPFSYSSYLNNEVRSLVVLGNRQRQKRHSSWSSGNDAKSRHT